MGAGGCKVILCICAAAQVLERTNEMMAYREAEGETVLDHGHVLDLIRDEVTGMYEIINTATSLSLVADLSTRRSMPVAMREGYKAVIANDEDFSDEKLQAVIDRGTKMERLGKQWEEKQLQDAGWPSG